MRLFHFRHEVSHWVSLGVKGLKGKLGDFFLFVQSFYRPKTKTSFNRQFSPKRPKLVKNQAKGSEIHQIRTKWHPSYCGNPSILSSIQRLKSSGPCRAHRLKIKCSEVGCFLHYRQSILFSTGEPCKDRLILTARSEDRIDGFPQQLGCHLVLIW